MLNVIHTQNKFTLLKHKLDQEKGAPRNLRYLKARILYVSFTALASLLCLAPQIDEVRKQTNISADKEDPGHPLPYHEPGQEDEEDNAEG